MAEGLVLDVNIDEILEFASDLANGPRVIARNMRATMRKSLPVLEHSIVARTPVNIGALRGSISHEMRGQGVDLYGRVFSPLEYGAAVERGRRPGRMPPIDAIQYWVERKGIAGDEDPRQVAFLIARAIGRRGTKGAFMFRDGLEAARPRVVRLWMDMGHNIVEELVR